MGLGVPAVLVCVVLVAVGASLLEGTGFDLMTYRKGPVLVGMIALALGVGAWSLVSSLSNRLLGKNMVHSLPPAQELSELTSHKAVIIVWTNEMGAGVGAAFKPKDPADIPVMIAGLRG